MPAVVTTYLGFHFGMVLQYFKSHGARLQQWVPFSLGLLVTGIVVHFAAWKANKQLWSPAYVLVMAGCNGLVLAGFYLLQDATYGIVICCCWVHFSRHFSASPPARAVWRALLYVPMLIGCRSRHLPSCHPTVCPSPVLRHWQPGWLKQRHRISATVSFGLTDVLRPFNWVGMNTIFIYLLSPAGGACYRHFDMIFGPWAVSHALLLRELACAV